MEPSPHPFPEGEGPVIPGGCKSPLPSQEARVRVPRKKRATISTFAAIPRQFRRGGPWRRSLCEMVLRQSGHVGLQSFVLPRVFQAWYRLIENHV